MHDPHTTRCALLHTSTDDLRTDFGLTLSKEAHSGPHRESYPCGITLDVRDLEESIAGWDGGDTSHIYTIQTHADWLHLSARLTQEGLLDRAKKFLGAEELQVGDKIFDQSVFIDCEPNNPDLTTFLSNPHVQSALLALLNYKGAIAVEFEKHTIRYRFNSYTNTLQDYTNTVLPVLALTLLAQQNPPT